MEESGPRVRRQPKEIFMLPGKNRNESPDAIMLGLGLDNEDGHKRITTGENFYLVGGSEETHERMAETAIKFNEKLSARGKRLGDLSGEEFRDMLREAADR